MLEILEVSLVIVGFSDYFTMNHLNAEFHGFYIHIPHIFLLNVESLELDIFGCLRFLLVTVKNEGFCHIFIYMRYLYLQTIRKVHRENWPHRLQAAALQTGDLLQHACSAQCLARARGQWRGKTLSTYTVNFPS